MPESRPIRWSHEHIQAARLALIYAFVGGLWILFSDQLLHHLTDEPLVWERLQTYKGWLFIGVTALLLYSLTLHQQRNLANANRNLVASIESVSRLNRVHRVLSSINGAILRIRDRDELLDEACRISVDQGEFVLAWVGTVTPEHTVVPAAWAGSDPAYLDGLSVSLDAHHPDAAGLVARAVRSRAPAVVEDTAFDTASLERHDQALAYGYRSAAAFPLEHQGQALGVLVLYSAVPAFFDENEIKLLEEVAADTALGLVHIELQRELAHAEHYDPLTTLPNRTLFLDRVEQALQTHRYNSRHVAVVIVSIQGLRHVNDSLGRGAGDNAIYSVAQHLHQSLRGGDAIARVGGNEFAVLLSGLGHAADTKQVVDKLLQHFPVRREHEGEEYVLNARAGASISTERSEDAESLLARADVAMQNARAKAANTWTMYAPEMGSAAHRRYKLERELHSALERDEFSVFYQPIIEADSGRALAAEALVRWYNPTQLGQVSPGEFIPVLEKTDLVHPVGTWIMGTAVEQLAHWQSNGFPDLHMSINIAAAQLLHEDFMHSLQSTLQANPRVMPGSLALEITETDLIRDFVRAMEVLDQVRAMGINIYLDDFGTGYSSLSYLNRLPVDTLKIDRSFIQRLSTDHSAKSLVSSIIGLAKGLEIDVIAEGVETKVQVDLLRELGCNRMQGYFFARPGPAEHLSAALAGPLTL